MNTKIIVFLYLILSVTSLVSAKSNPYVEDPQVEWGDVSAPDSIAIWDGAAAHVGRLGEYGDVDAFMVDFPEATDGWELELIVPVCGEHFKDFFPSVAIIGPGLDTPEAGMLPFAVPEGMGVQIYSDEDDKKAYLESGKRGVISSNYVTGEPAYRDTRQLVTIPEAGQYIVAVFEPEGNVGAFMLSTGSKHDQFGDRSNAELDAAYNSLFSGDWMGQDCKAAVAAANCPATGGSIDADSIPDGPERAQVGEGFVLSGIVRDTATCLPIANAQVAFWMTNEDGVYEESGEGVLHTNAQGRYRLESGIPGQYDNVTPHIHLAVSAPGYDMAVTEFLFQQADIESGTVDVNLAPEA
jgi:hypothetical protein